ncbi:MAG TPA: menaquinone-dependent protoporphyrinogen IX dehydrogenase [Candidatus Aphodousia faecavium]|uniref:Protoporphyrinogen IX dehydrogenase [quinone] n=1 Tax=Parasutterella secunda TaxID=626947 RepID=A0ABS2GQK9_9BURK|nr:menaquinone-dependent protoporphyrinogen IX dehydrogenase [Parasutterella secunda]MBM6928060.1 menaquinone-dependent protoporphyrinogen IX dehydrogenase [Parasutterella secunda]HIT96747.1 menaquinone-dependent protoporphyrinogen IX dehydrogenase [Candidatus Aphodousia faecavium]
MKSVLVLYHSRSGHTARVARRIWETVIAEGNQADMMSVMEADREGVQWDKYDLFIVGCPVLYGTYPKVFYNFLAKFKNELDAKPHSFFNVSVVARTPIKATPEGNRYMQKFLQNSPWKPRDVKCIAGKVDYPNWGWLDAKMIQLIMKMTKGPTSMDAVIDYTDWEDVKSYARHCLTLS